MRCDIQRTSQACKSRPRNLPSGVGHLRPPHLVKKEPVETGSKITSRSHQNCSSLFLLVAVRWRALLATVLLAFRHVALALWHVAALATLLTALAGRGRSVIAILSAALIAPAFSV